MTKAKKKGRPSKYLIVMSIVLSALCMILLVADVISCREENLTIVSREKQNYLQSIAYAGNYDAEDIIAYVKEEYPTSASDYFFVAVDNQLLFVRDDNYTKTLKETNFRKHFGIITNGVKIQGCDMAYQVMMDGEKWNVIFHNQKRESDILTTGICIRNEQLLAEGNFDLLLQHSVLYMALFSIAFIVSIVFLSYREKENQQMEEKLKGQLVENRRLIERLGEKLEAQSEMEYYRENGFCTREVICQIAETLTKEQKEKTYRVSVRLNEATPKAIMRYSILLERLNANKYVCCLWEENEFMVLLLNTDEQGANNFIKLFLLQYQKMFQSDARDIHISMEKMGDL